MKKFVLLVEYGMGEMAMVTDTPDLSKALEEFRKQRMQNIPDTKDYGLPPVLAARLVPLLYETIYERKEA